MSDDEGPRSGGSTSSVEDTALGIHIGSDSDSSQQRLGDRASREATFDSGAEPVTLSLLARLLALALAFSACIVATEAGMLWASRWLLSPVELAGAARLTWIAARLLSLSGGLHLCGPPTPSPLSSRRNGNTASSLVFTQTAAAHSPAARRSQLLLRLRNPLQPTRVEGARRATHPACVRSVVAAAATAEAASAGASPPVAAPGAAALPKCICLLGTSQRAYATYTVCLPSLFTPPTPRPASPQPRNSSAVRRLFRLWQPKFSLLRATAVQSLIGFDFP